MGLQTVPSTQEEVLALCLMMLSGGRDAPRAPVGPLPVQPTPSFKCSVCSKSFPSYQALGGHKSSHRRPPAGLGLEVVRAVPVSSASGSSGSGGAHRCNVCHREFATGQALGGHKRCHYWDSSSSYSTSISTVRDFDLNLLPAESAGVWGVEDGVEVQSPHPAAKKKMRLI